MILTLSGNISNDSSYGTEIKGKYSLCYKDYKREMLIIISFRVENSRQVKRVEEVSMQHIIYYDSWFKICKTCKWKVEGPFKLIKPFCLKEKKNLFPSCDLLYNIVCVLCFI